MTQVSEENAVNEAFPKLVSKALRFLSVVVKMGSHREMFAAPDTLRAFCEKIILPNMSIRRRCFIRILIAAERI